MGTIASLTYGLIGKVQYLIDGNLLNLNYCSIFQSMVLLLSFSIRRLLGTTLALVSGSLRAVFTTKAVFELAMSSSLAPGVR